ncbi:MAG: YdeI/OmpD-associated family protein [Bacteroidota bacterium]
MLVRLRGRIVDLYETLGYSGLTVNAQDVVELLEHTTDRRVLCRFPDADVVKHAALMHDGNGHYFINISKEIRKEVGIDFGDEVDFELSPDNSKYGMPLPEEMAVLLEQDPEADRVFHTLTLGKQRSLLYLIGKPKTSDTRLTKALGVVEYLKSTNGKLDFKELNDSLKQK